MNFIYALDLLGTFAFAVTGALVATQKKMDLIGLTVLAIVTAVGGGSLRDLLLGTTPVFYLLNQSYLYIALLAAIITFFLHRTIVRVNYLIQIFDAIGIGTFICIGSIKAISADIDILGTVFLGTMTAIFGGVIRDVLAGEIPFVFSKDFYASAAILGNLLFIYLYSLGISLNIIVVITTILVLVLRLLAIKYSWRIPKPSSINC